ncbi:hypothetical protein ABBZ21_19810 [Acinetobacter baumannii]|uniref:hypothetical protein n=1 Tax=Acinetobacter baumannii TaxID=470 RepID=UPI00385A99DF
MTNFNIQRANALAIVWALALLIVIVFIIGALLVRPYQTIDEGRNNELQAMVNTVQGTPFEVPFKAKINYYLQDGKINKNEFSKISDLYSGFKSSKVTGQEKTFSVKTMHALEEQYKSDDQNRNLFQTLFYFVCGIVGLFILIIFNDSFINGKSS